MPDVTGVKDRANRIGEAASQIQQRVKSILRQLKPIDVLDFGLDVAIRELFSFWQARFPDLNLTLRNASQAHLDRVQEEVIYRVVQESLSNAVRHGHPKSVAILIAGISPDTLAVTITDDGRGFALPRPARGSGLNGMTERVASLGGNLSVENNTPAHGVIVRVTLPIKTEREAA